MSIVFWSMDYTHTLQMSDKQSSSLPEVVRNYGAQLLRFIKGKVKKVEDAEDILQEVWYQTSRLSNIDQLENVSAWLYSITRNKITDLYRKKKTDAIEDHTYMDDEGELKIKEILLADDSNNAELKLFKEVFWEELMKALDELPEKQRDVFVLNEIEDMTLQQIADLKGENIKTIISRKGYAVKHLRLRLNMLYEELKY
ncbi:RNA polymerase sigma factor sigV [Sphingobacterium spiritivorum]|uniref:RNA polymerase sigma factor sigV n=1 Tax=Sphingobacterium spiritivorum TaxID=258 RepID=A0A380CW89_SPHSI|nr:RNA polymerase sigma factor [Sphingobacterium spiritivorum]SUJ29821.1 RNA polymerase sigma factor sigV [Sphingobacterium spiritivorum]